MPGSRPRDVILTVPQRLALADFRPTLVDARGARPLEPTGAHSWSVIPVRPIRLPSASAEVTESYRAKVLKHLDGADPIAVELVRGRESVPAVAVPGLSDKKARAVARNAEVDVVWQVRDDTSFLMADGDPPAEGTGKATLLDLLTGLPCSWTETVASWTTSDRPGWVQGGPLGVSCETCQVHLIWFDWWASEAASRRSSWLVGCPEHGPVPWSRSKVDPLVQTRRQLDSALWIDPAVEALHHCYVFEFRGLGPGAIYVGETALTIEKRLEQHRTGQNAAKELSKSGVTMGSASQSSLPHLPDLLTRSASRAAEQWVAAVLARHGLVVYGGH